MLTAQFFAALSTFAGAAWAAGPLPPPVVPESYFNLTAITAQAGRAVLECWQLTQPLAISGTKGIAGASVQNLGNFASGSYSSLPANFPGTAHPAPVVQYVAFLSGRTQITIPGSPQQAIFEGGKHGLILAADTAAVTQTGHVSTTLDEPVTALQIPTLNGVVPDHKVLYANACGAAELGL